MTTITLQPEHAYVLACLPGMALVNFVLGGLVGVAREKYGVRVPQLYATRGMFIDENGKVDDEKFKKNGIEFNKVQRGHQHMTETYAEALALLLTCGLFYPKYAAQWGVSWIVGTFLYAIGYSYKPSYRVIGEVFYVPANWAWIYGIYCAAHALYYGKPI